MSSLPERNFIKSIKSIKSNRRKVVPFAIAISFVILIGPFATLALFPPQESLATPPGVNGKVAFADNRDGDYEIFSMNPDGSGQTELTNNLATDWLPSWSPNGELISFVSDRDGNFEIYKMNADGSGQTRLTNNLASDYNPAWSPDGSKIAFATTRDGGDWEIYTMDAGGFGLTRLTNSPGIDDEPAWSPDGTKIAFSSFRDGNREIYVMNAADGSGQTNISNNLAQDRRPSWSPFGGQIAFTSDRDLNFEIYKMNSDGTSPTRLTTNSAADQAPSWSPDGTKIVFDSQRDPDSEIYIMNSDGTGQTNISNHIATDFAPDFGPIAATISFDQLSYTVSQFPVITVTDLSADISGASDNVVVAVASDSDLVGLGGVSLTETGAHTAVFTGNISLSSSSMPGHLEVQNGDTITAKYTTSAPPPATIHAFATIGKSVVGDKLAFTSTRDGNFEIYIMNSDGTGQTRLTNNGAMDTNPSFSPDGTKITFESDRDGLSEIYIMNSDGTGQTRLTNNAAVDTNPSFSPDGTKITFESARDGNYEIYIMNSDGTAQTNLSNNPSLDSKAKFSPDGTKIAFSSDRDGNSEIYRMNAADGTGQTNLTNNPSGDFLPVYSPDGAKIAFVSIRDGNEEIYAMNSDGTGQTRITNNPAADNYPSFSLLGSPIAFGSNRDGNFEIYTMNSDGTGQTNLTNDPDLDEAPNFGALSADIMPPTISQVSDSPDPFSPNGDTINDTTTVTFSSDETGPFTLQILNSTNMGGQNVTGVMVVGVNNVVWDGSGFAEPTVPNGVYKYLIEADDSSGNRGYGALPLGSQTITVDTGLSILIDSISPSPTWGAREDVFGSITGILTPGQTVKVDYGDGSFVTLPASNSWDTTGTAGHVYPISDIGNSRTITATLYTATGCGGAGCPVDSFVQTVVVDKRPTVTSVSVPSAVERTNFTAAGTVTDYLTGAPLGGKSVTFSGTGAAPFSARTTTGITFTGSANEIVSCATSPAPTPICAKDVVGSVGPNTEDVDPSDNRVFAWGVTNRILLPIETDKVVITFAGGPVSGGAVTLSSVPFDIYACTSDCALSNSVVFHYSTSGAVTGTQEMVYSSHGLTELRLQSVAGSTTAGFIGIESIQTANVLGFPTQQHITNFEKESTGLKSSSYVPDNGFFFSTGTVPATTVPATITPNLEVNAVFAGDSLYAPSTGSDLYDILPDPRGGEAGLGQVQITAGADTAVAVSVSSAAPCVDEEFPTPDSLCSSWENSGGKIILTGDPGAGYDLRGSDTRTVAQASALGTLPDASIPDIYVELDYFAGYAPTDTEIRAVEDAFSNQGINLHLILGEQLPSPIPNPLHMWSDSSSARLDGSQTNTKVKTTGTTADLTRSFTITQLNVVTSGTVNPTINLKAKLVFNNNPGTLSANTAGFANEVLTAANAKTGVQMTGKGSAIGTVTTTVPSFSAPVASGACGGCYESTVSFTLTPHVTGAATSATGILGTITMNFKVGLNNVATLNSASLASGSPIITNNDDFDGIKANYFGTPTERLNAGGTFGMNKYLLKEKAQAYHYGVMAVNSGIDPTHCGSSGEAELTDTNDFVVTLGNAGGTICFASDPLFNPSDARKGTVMHEIGHLLGLKHGGGDDDNCKPNYLSVMSYTRQFQSSSGIGSLDLDYSGEKYDDVFEKGISEITGITGGPTGQLTVWSLNDILSAATATGNTGGNIDWDKIGGIGHPPFTLGGAPAVSSYTTGTGSTKTVTISGGTLTTTAPTGYSSALSYGSIILDETITMNNAYGISSISLGTRTGQGTAGGLLIWNPIDATSNLSVVPGASKTIKIHLVLPFKTTNLITTGQSVGSIPVTFTLSQLSGGASTSLGQISVVPPNPIAKKGWALDLNYMSAIGCNAPPGTKTILHGFNDWTNLKYSFRSAGTFDGVQSFGNDPTTDAPNPSTYATVDTTPTVVPEVTPQIYNQIRSAEANGYTGLLQPVNDVAFDEDGSSIFKAGNNVIPLKFRLQGSPSTALVTFKLFKVGAGPDPGGYVETTQSGGSGDSGDRFRYDPTTQQWIFNLGTKNLAKGKYIVLIFYTESPGKPTILLHKYAPNSSIGALVPDSNGGEYSGWFNIAPK